MLQSSAGASCVCMGVWHQTSLEKLKEQKLPFSLNSLTDEMRDIVTNLLWSDPFEYTDKQDSFPVKNVAKIGGSTITAYENPKRGPAKRHLMSCLAAFWTSTVLTY